MDHAIETERLTCRYGRTRAVADLTMHVPTGSIYALLGPNGAGKTTTLTALMNLRRPASGTARSSGSTRARSVRPNSPASATCPRTSGSPRT